MLPGDRLICALVIAQTIGSQFKVWPLHVTIIPWFRLSTLNKVMAGEVGLLLASTTEFPVLIGPDTYFGRSGQKLVSLIELPTPFIEVEHLLRAYFQARKPWIADETTKRRPLYKPHVTVQSNARLHPGDIFCCNCLYIIEQKGDYKEVMSIIPLAGHE